MPSTGFCMSGWESVRSEFDRILSDPKEGGQVCVYHEGEKVVDLVGGCMDEANSVPVMHSTLSQVFSATKGASALMLAMLVDEGSLDLDAPVAKYWPAFAQNGKGTITVRLAAGHRGGLWKASHVDFNALLDFKLHMKIIEEQVAEPILGGYTSSYHAFTLGIIHGGLIFHITGKTPNEFFQERVAIPLGLDFYIGYPPAAEASRITFKRTKVTPSPTDPKYIKLLNEMTTEGSRFSQAMIKFDPNQTVSIADPQMYEHMNNPAILKAENTSWLGFTNARSLARMYASMLWPVDGVRTISAATLAIVSKAEPEGPNDVQLDWDLCSWGPTGFAGPHAIETHNYMLGPKTNTELAHSFGSPGAGGSIGVAHESLGIAAAYVPTYYATGMKCKDTTLALGKAISSAAIELRKHKKQKKDHK